MCSRLLHINWDLRWWGLFYHLVKRCGPVALCPLQSVLIDDDVLVVKSLLVVVEAALVGAHVSCAQAQGIADGSTIQQACGQVVIAIATG